MSSLTEALEADRVLAAEITPPFTGSDPLVVASQEAAARHNGRLDAPAPGKKGGWDARVSGVRIDQADQSRHPWTTIGHGETAEQSLRDLIVKLDDRSLAAAPSFCPTCHQLLPEDLAGASRRTDAPD